jgi:hypothetical protein
MLSLKHFSQLEHLSNPSSFLLEGGTGLSKGLKMIPSMRKETVQTPLYLQRHSNNCSTTLKRRRTHKTWTLLAGTEEEKAEASKALQATLELTTIALEVVKETGDFPTELLILLKTIDTLQDNINRRGLEATQKIMEVLKETGSIKPTDN